MKLNSVTLSVIKDSRGEDTLRAEVKSGKIHAIAEVPSGKSRGSHEAFVLEPVKAVKKLDSIKEKILAADFKNQSDFDHFLIGLDATSNKKNLGGNLTLALSLAWARTKAKEEGVELYQYISSLFGKPLRKDVSFVPWPIFNVIEGGAHVHPELAEGQKNSLDIQEFQVIPTDHDFTKAFELGKQFYSKLKSYLEKKYNKENVVLGDEAGFSAPIKNNEEALQILSALIKANNFDLKIGLDIAANELFNRGSYFLNKKKYKVEELTHYYLDLFDKYRILSVEDPFGEEAFDDFANLKEEFLKKSGRKNSPFIITDDLTTTNPERLLTAIRKNSGGAIIIKPNQIGTLTETIEVAKMAEKAKWGKIVSHRSGETKDDFIADLAVGIQAWGIKAGAPARPERLAKYNRLLEIAEKFN